MGKVTLSFITTVFNEEKTIEHLLNSLLSQTKKVDEIIIVDSKSTDSTTEKIQSFEKRCKQQKIQLRLISKKSNRSEGRNIAISEAQGRIILVTDAGCYLKSDWVEKITQPFKGKEIDVVAGFYKAVTENIFQKSLATYTCVMEDRVTEDFLPSSRSVAFAKSAWKKAGGYPEELSTCEDLVFARKLKQKKLSFYVQKKAIVYWPQRKNLAEAFKQFFAYAKGDGEALYIRRNTPFLFLRYIAVLILAIWLFSSDPQTALVIFSLLFLIYASWAIQKNYRYVKHPLALFYLPMLQIASDVAVILGMSSGSMKRFMRISF